MARSAKSKARRRKKRRDRNPLAGVGSPVALLANRAKGGPHKDRKKEANRKACRRWKGD
jgi:hypothetical protein